MRWQRLFDDLYAQAEELDAAELRAEISERSRSEAGLLLIADRLTAALGHGVELTVLGGGQVSGTLCRVGVDWVLLLDALQRELIVAIPALTSVSGLGRRTEVGADRGAVHAALDLRKAIRAVARDRSAVWLVLIDGSAVGGTVDRVGADFLELAEHPVAEPRRAAAVQRVRTVLLSAVALVRAG